MIDSYRFGTMIINNQTFTSDLIIFPDGTIEDHWYRRQGHVLEMSDLSTLTPVTPRLIIAGTGAHGRLVPVPGLEDQLQQMGIELKAMATAQAVELYNQLKNEGTGQGVAACFHLTC